MKVRNIGSNQSEIEHYNGVRVLISYSTPVAAFVPGTGYVKTDESFSPTTSRHINRWTDGRGTKVAQSEIVALASGTPAPASKIKAVPVNENPRRKIKPRE